ncbi:hypothetical protein K456DRAFT_1289677 [Colletotrichum gloeosporioides 23]|nr:hypothetical protein K456DRAFT_1289677 [Colletotrichum gloeosporioides 23]
MNWSFAHIQRTADGTHPVQASFFTLDLLGQVLRQANINKNLSYSMLLFAIVTTQYIVFSALFHDGGCHLRTRHGLRILCVKELSARLMRVRETSVKVIIHGSVFDSKISETQDCLPGLQEH